MSYCLEECGAYKTTTIKATQIIVFNEHNLALPVWGTYSSRNNVEYNLITFDSHTDTHAPFSAYLCMNNEHIVYGRKALNNPYIKQLLKDVNYNRECFEFEELFKLSHSRVTNTEQIQTAYAMGYLKSYTVIHRDEADGYESYDRSYGINAKYIKADDFVGIQYEESMLPIVLDFDLDFFRNKNELDMLFFFSISEIINNASVITIAREPKYFETCRTDSCFTNQEALDILIERLECILS